MKSRVRVLVGAVVLATAGTVTMAGSGGAAAAPPPRVVAGFPAPSEAEQTFFSWMNRERTSRGLAPLSRSGALDGAARSWSRAMASGACGGRLCHRKDLLQVVRELFPGRWSRAAENVGRVPFGGTIESLHDAFMNSRGHRANILLASFNTVGVGVAIAEDGMLYVTVEFVALKSASASAPSPAPAPVPNANPSPAPKAPAVGAPSKTPTLRRGSVGSAVRRLQRALGNAGIRTFVDGRFGPKTQRSVQTFQAARGLAVTGVVDAATWSALGQ